MELEPGIEGLVHVSEMSWTKKNVHPGKIVSTSQEVEVMVLDVDPVKRRISLGLKQCLDNPWTSFVDKYPVGTELQGDVKNITEFGLFVGLPGEIDGMVHLSDLSWDKPGEEAVQAFKKGDSVKVKVLDVDVEKERISLGIKQLQKDTFAEAANTLKKGSVVTCTVTAVVDGGIEVAVQDGLSGFIKKADLSRERSEQRPDRFAVGEKVDAKIIQVDPKSRRLTLSIKARRSKRTSRRWPSSVRPTRAPAWATSSARPSTRPRRARRTTKKPKRQVSLHFSTKSGPAGQKTRRPLLFGPFRRRFDWPAVQST